MIKQAVFLYNIILTTGLWKSIYVTNIVSECVCLL